MLVPFQESLAYLTAFLSCRISTNPNWLQCLMTYAYSFTDQFFILFFPFVFLPYSHPVTKPTRPGSYQHIEYLVRDLLVAVYSDTKQIAQAKLVLRDNVDLERDPCIINALVRNEVVSFNLFLAIV